MSAPARQAAIKAGLTEVPVSIIEATPQEIAEASAKAMWNGDSASQRLGMSLDHVAPGEATNLHGDVLRAEPLCGDVDEVLDEGHGCRDGTGVRD